MNIALLLSGGTGRRMGTDLPKQYISVYGKMIITRCLERLCRHPMIDAVQIVAAEEWRDVILAECACTDKLRGFSAPGVNRQMSILNGLRDISQYAGKDDVVLVHDAARPLISEDLISDCLTKIADHDGVMPALPMTDTVYYSTDGKQVEQLLDRSRIFAGQAPEAFRLGSYLEANERLLPDEILSINGSTEPAIMAQLDIVMIPGDKNNLKITTRNDLDLYSELLAKESRE